MPDAQNPNDLEPQPFPDLPLPPRLDAIKRRFIASPLEAAGYVPGPDGPMSIKPQTACEGTDSPNPDADPVAPAPTGPTPGREGPVETVGRYRRVNGHWMAGGVRIPDGLAPVLITWERVRLWAASAPRRFLNLVRRDEGTER